MKMENAIKQEKFKDEWIRVAVNMYYTQSQLQYASHTCLKPFDISVQQFNILRILRGQRDKALTVSEITDRMIDKMSNASRLIEKLRRKRLVVRTEDQYDRRRVNITISKEGLLLLNEASEAMEKHLTEKLAGLSKIEANQLNVLLDKINT
ncbi:MAG: MarR family transcriptional regulator [Saprospiraceae bacterium]|nr:MarR family transcriptional regulator [Saprospiraceae bacterium]